MKKNTVIHARCTNEQRQIIKERADKAGLTLSEYVIKSALHSRTRISSVGKDMTRTITQFQVCINNMQVELKKMQSTEKIELGSLEKNIIAAQEGLDELWRLSKSLVKNIIVKIASEILLDM